MAAVPRLRVAFDANVLIAGMQWPRWPFEVMRAALQSDWQLCLPVAVVHETQKHLPAHLHGAFGAYLAAASCEELLEATLEEVESNRHLVRSAKDVGIAFALIEARVDIFVTSDRDFTDPGATAPAFSEKVQVMLPADFLKVVCHWTSDELEAVRTRTWDDPGLTP